MVCILILGMTFLAADPQQQAQPPPRETSQGPDPALLAEYNARRAKAPNTADAHWKLGLWCEQNGLKTQAEVEFLAVSQFDPRREAAWKKLGYIKHEGRWTTPAALAAQRAEAEAQRKADARWRPLLQKWKAGLARKDKRAEAEAALAAVNDPRAVPSIWRIFATGGPDDQERAIDILGHIEGERPSRALAGLAIFGKTDLVRGAAVETLTRRHADEVMISWIGLLRAPIKYEVRQVAGPGLPGMLLVEGEKFNVRRFYAPPTVSQTQGVFIDHEVGIPTYPLQFNSTPPGPPLGAHPVGFFNNTALFVYDYTWAPPPPPPNKYGDPTSSYQQFEQNQIQAKLNLDFELEQTAKMAAGAQAQLQQDVNVVEEANATIRERNTRLVEALRGVSGKDLGEDREAWLKWWMDRRGYTYIPPKDRAKATVDVQVALPYVPSGGPPRVNQGGQSGAGWCLLWDHEKGQPPILNKCFAAGTRVLTPGGHRAIETLRDGDLVLTGRGPDGAERTASILSVHQSAASRTLRLVASGDVIVTTDGHPFRKAGAGWTRAGDLKAGDEVLAINGSARVDSIEVQDGATVWNLRLNESSAYLVGRQGMIVHDLSPVADVNRMP